MANSLSINTDLPIPEYMETVTSSTGKPILVLRIIRTRAAALSRQAGLRCASRVLGRYRKGDYYTCFCTLNLTVPIYMHVSRDANVRLSLLLFVLVVLCSYQVILV